MYKIEYLESVVKKDITVITKAEKEKIKKAIENKLAIDPISFGKPLQYSLKACRRLRVGNYRIIYKIESEKNCVLIVKIGHRKEVYEDY